MPVGVSWKEFYQTEYNQMIEEGYDVGTLPRAIRASLSHLGTRDSAADDGEWEEAYRTLIAQKAKGIRADFPYDEPWELPQILALADSPPEVTPLSAAEYANRIRGAWFGRCAAVMLGKPLEMGLNRQEVRQYLESVGQYPLCDWVEPRSEKLGITLREDCLPSSKGHVSYVQADDDIHYTICSLLLAERCGESFTRWDAAQNLLDNITYNWVWTADKYLYWQLVQCDTMREFDRCFGGIPAAANPWRESMCPQLKADLWGYITPGEMRRGAAMIYRLGSLSAVKNGLYGGMFMQGCVSAALTKNPDVRTILKGGLCNIPSTCRLYEAIQRVIRWHETLPDWTAVCDKIYETYGHWYFAGAINNICFIVLALLEGDLDFQRTISTAVMCGTDTDCNSGNAGSIVAAAVGYEALDRKWVEPIHDEVHSAVAGFGFGSVSDLVQRTLQVRKKFSVYAASPVS